MPLNLSDIVDHGELFSCRNSVQGWLGLRNGKDCIRFDLTGNCEPDLEGRNIRFESRHPRQLEKASPDLTELAWHQIGPAGKITAALQIKARHENAWKPSLYLEWFSQNGRVIVELIDPLIQDIDMDSPQEATVVEDIGDDFDLPFGDELPDDMEFQEETSEFKLMPDDMEFQEETSEFKLMPDGLQQHLDAKSASLDRIAADDDRDSIRELELMDYLIKFENAETMDSVVGSLDCLPDPDTLNENQAQVALRTLLTKLALHGIAFDMCAHFTALDAYRLLMTEILKEERFYLQLQRTRWVQHLSSFDYCPACNEEFECGYGETNRKIKSENEDSEE